MTKEEYMETRKDIGLTRTEFSRLLNYGEGKQPYGFKIVYQKETGYMNISNSDAAICNIIKAGLKIAPKTTLRIVKLTVKYLGGK